MSAVFANRLDDLNAKLTARTGPDGKPMKGYGRNVTALKAEIARLTNSTNLGVDKPHAAVGILHPDTTDAAAALATEPGD